MSDVRKETRVAKEWGPTVQLLFKGAVPLSVFNGIRNPCSVMFGPRTIDTDSSFIRGLLGGYKQLGPHDDTFSVC